MEIEVTATLRDWCDRKGMRALPAGTGAALEAGKMRGDSLPRQFQGRESVNDSREKPVFHIVARNDHAVSTMPTSQKRTNRLSLVCMDGEML